MNKVFAAMTGLGNEANANPGKNWMVCTYWQHSAGTVPTPEIREAIEGVRATSQWFAAQVRYGTIHSASRVIKHQLSIRIGLPDYGNDTGNNHLAVLAYNHRVEPHLNHFQQVVME